MYCNIIARTGSQNTAPVQFDGSKMARFVVKSDYNNADRRCWFDNLKIQRITAGEVETIKGDLNGDGIVNALDIQVIINASIAEDNSFDQTGDGICNALDIQTIIMIAAATE
jgi:hypothetical protein